MDRKDGMNCCLRTLLRKITYMDENRYSFAVMMKGMKPPGKGDYIKEISSASGKLRSDRIRE